jgi:hypothetical protein
LGGIKLVEAACFLLVANLAYCLTLKIEAGHSSEMSVNYQTIRGDNYAY